METTQTTGTHIQEILNLVKERKPLVHHITNYVVANETANLTLCFGVLPVMTHSIDEAIGGIDARNAEEVYNNGAASIAVISAIAFADDVEKETKELIQISEPFTKDYARKNPE